MENKIKEILKRNIQSRFEKHLTFWTIIEMENFIDYSTEEIVKLFTIPDVINSKKPIEQVLPETIKESYDKIKDNLEPPL